MTEVEMIARVGNNVPGDVVGLPDSLAETLAAAGAVRIVRRDVPIEETPMCSEAGCPFPAGDVGDGLQLCSEHRRCRFVGARVGRVNRGRDEDAIVE